MLNEKAKNTAFKLLEKFGKNGIYKRQAGQIYDPKTGEISLNYESRPVKAYIDSAKSYSNLIEKGLLNEGDSVILIAAKSLPFAPQNNDKIGTYTIQYNDAVWGGEDIALHQLVAVWK